MFCPNCGTKNPDQSKFCAGCGAALQAPPAPQQQPVPPVAPAQPAPQQESPVVHEAHADQPAKAKLDVMASIKSALRDLLGVVKPLVDKVKPIVMKNKWLSLGIVALVAVLLIGGIVWGILRSGTDYIALEHDILVTNNGDSLVILYDDEVFDTKIDAEPSAYMLNLDQTCMALLTEDDSLYVFDGDELTHIASDVSDYLISTTGEGIVYLKSDNDEYNLYLYDVDGEESEHIAELTTEPNGFVISPDGQSVAYAVYNDGEYKIMYYTDGENTRITSGEGYQVVGMSDDGEQIYILQYSLLSSGLYCCNADGDKVKLASDFYTVSFNADFTQILFIKEGKTYISTEGADPVKISSNRITPLVPRTSDKLAGYDAITVHPVGNLYEKVYVGIDGNGNRSVWYICEDEDDSFKLVSNISNPTLDQSGEYLYYLDRYDKLMVLEIADGESASDKAVTLASDVEGYMVTSDRSLVYYVSNECIYSVDGETGRNKQTVCSEEVNEAGMNSDDVFFYMIDGDVYATDNGKRGSRIMSDIRGLEQGVHCVYAYTSDEVYVSVDSDEFEKILTRK